MNKNEYDNDIEIPNDGMYNRYITGVTQKGTQLTIARPCDEYYTQKIEEKARPQLKNVREGYVERHRGRYFFNESFDDYEKNSSITEIEKEVNGQSIRERIKKATAGLERKIKKEYEASDIIETAGIWTTVGSAAALFGYNVMAGYHNDPRVVAIEDQATLAGLYVGGTLTNAITLKQQIDQPAAGILFAPFIGMAGYVSGAVINGIENFL